MPDWSDGSCETESPVVVSPYGVDAESPADMSCTRWEGVSRFLDFLPARPSRHALGQCQEAVGVLKERFFAPLSGAST